MHFASVKIGWIKGTTLNNYTDTAYVIADEGGFYITTRSLVEFVLVNSNETWVKTERYIEAFERLINNRTNWYYCEVLGSVGNRVCLQIGV